jgi:hypothetical protein
VIMLPLHIAWSGPPRSFALSDRKQRARAYEQVLREGTTCGTSLASTSCSTRGSKDPLCRLRATWVSCTGAA